MPAVPVAVTQPAVHAFGATVGASNVTNGGEE